jgi:hypothetical protein
MIHSALVCLHKHAEHIPRRSSGELNSGLPPNPAMGRRITDARRVWHERNGYSELMGRESIACSAPVTLQTCWV